MPIQNLGREQWLNHKPHKDRDVRRTFSRFFEKSDALRERQERIRILRKGTGKNSQRLAQALLAAPKSKPAAVGCCPVFARLFQVYFADRALQVHEAQPDEGVRYTLLDPTDAVKLGRLRTVDWRKLHLKLRRRIERELGRHVVVYGMGEVEADDSRGVWQPHHHLTIHGASKTALKAFRKAYYPSKRTGIRKMVKSKPQPIEGWFTYISKLVAFAKTRGPGPSKRERLPDGPSREHFKYLSQRRPTSFVFAMNCRIVKKGE